MECKIICSSGEDNKCSSESAHSTAGSSPDVDGSMITDPIEQCSKFDEMDVKHLCDKSKLDIISNLVRIMQNLDKKLHYIQNHLGEIDVNVDTIAKDVSSQIEAYDNKMSCRFESFEDKLNKIETVLSRRTLRSETLSNRQVSFCSNADASGRDIGVSMAKKVSERQVSFRGDMDGPGSDAGISMATRKVTPRRSSIRRSYAPVSSNEYDVKRISKNDDEKKMIYNVIKSSSYYEYSMCCDDELKDIINAFDIESFPAGSIIAKQGDTFERFYIVKSGIVDMFIDEAYVSSLTMKQPFGSSFMIGSTSLSSFRARDSCEIWFIPVDLLGFISTHYKRKRLLFKTYFLKMVSLLNFRLNAVKF